jgi:alpha-beta hydrolase superfamily lysophospholipase
MARRLFIGLLGVIVGAAVLLGVVGEVLTRPATRAVGFPPPDLNAVVVRLPLPPSDYVTGWFTRGVPKRGAVLLLHGVRSDRRQMLGRARFLAAAGYSVLLIDLPAHGESSGGRISFGARESMGVSAALTFLRRELPQARIGVIGVSLGAAALVLARSQPPPDAVVLESMYTTIDDAVANRLEIRYGAVGRQAAPLLLWQMSWRLGISSDDLRPIAWLPGLGAPLLIAAGTADRHARWSETKQLFAVASAPKDIWAVEGARHVDLYRRNPSDYEARILPFLAKHLRGH